MQILAKVGIALPNLPGITPSLIPEYARRIEAGGFEAVWSLDRLVYENPDPLTALAASAAVTSRVRLGTSILLAPLHPPVLLAKQLATLDVLSNGRLIVGVGIGGRPDDFSAVGVPLPGRGARTAEAIRIMKQVWAAETFPNACLAYFNVRDNPERAKDEAMAALTRYYGPQFTAWYNPDKALVFGPPEECARRAQAYLEAGAQHLILVPTTLDVTQVDRIAREVLPRLRLDRGGHA